MPYSRHWEKTAIPLLFKKITNYPWPFFRHVGEDIIPPPTLSSFPAIVDIQISNGDEGSEP